MMRSIARRGALISALWLFAGTAQAAIVNAEAHRGSDGALALAWTETNGAAVDVFMGQDAKASLDQMTLISSADEDGRHSVAPASAAARTSSSGRRTGPATAWPSGWCRWMAP